MDEGSLYHVRRRQPKTCNFVFQELSGRMAKTNLELCFNLRPTYCAQVFLLLTLASLQKCHSSKDLQHQVAHYTQTQVFHNENREGNCDHWEVQEPAVFLRDLAKHSIQNTSVSTLSRKVSPSTYPHPSR